MFSRLFMAVFKCAAWAGVNHTHDRINIHFIRDDPRLTFQVEEFGAAAHAVSRVLTDTGVEVDINFLTGIGPVPGLQEIVIHDIASVVIMLSGIGMMLAVRTKKLTFI